MSISVGLCCGPDLNAGAPRLPRERREYCSTSCSPAQLTDNVVVANAEVLESEKEDSKSLSPKVTKEYVLKSQGSKVVMLEK